MTGRCKRDKAFPFWEDLAPIIEIDLSEPEGLELTSADLSSGQMFIEVAHSLECYLNLAYSFPGVTVNGSPVTVSMELPPANAAEAGMDSVLVDLTDANFDFGLVNGFDTNALAVELFVSSGEVTSEGHPSSGDCVGQRGDDAVFSLVQHRQTRWLLWSVDRVWSN